MDTCVLGRRVEDGDDVCFDDGSAAHSCSDVSLRCGDGGRCAASTVPKSFIAACGSDNCSAYASVTCESNPWTRAANGALHQCSPSPPADADSVSASSARLALRTMSLVALAALSLFIGWARDNKAPTG